MVVLEAICVFLESCSKVFTLEPWRKNALQIPSTRVSNFHTSGVLQSPTIGINMAASSSSGKEDVELIQFPNFLICAIQKTTRALDRGSIIGALLLSDFSMAVNR